MGVVDLKRMKSFENRFFSEHLMVKRIFGLSDETALFFKNKTQSSFWCPSKPGMLLENSNWLGGQL